MKKSLVIKKFLVIAILLLSLVGSAGQAAAGGGHGTASPSGTTWESLGITWE